MHLSYVFAGHGFDYEAVVVGGEEAVTEATLRVAVERSAPGQRVLHRQVQSHSAREDRDRRGSILEQNRCPVIYLWVRVHLIVLVIDAKALPQVPEHHGTVLFELKATRQVFSGNKDTSESGLKQEGTRKRRICSVLNLQGRQRKG